jgi:hypothetical protein
VHLAGLVEVVSSDGSHYIAVMGRRTAIWRVIRNALILTVISVVVAVAFSWSSVITIAALVLVGSVVTGLFAFRRDIVPANE